MGAKAEGKHKESVKSLRKDSDARKQPVVVAHRPKQAVPLPSNAPQEAFGGFHRLDEDTIKYFIEAKSHLDGLDDPEEQALLVMPPTVSICRARSPLSPRNRLSC